MTEWQAEDQPTEYLRKQGPRPQEFNSFARERAIHLDLNAPPADNSAKLAPLTSIVATKRFAFVGEPHQFIHEKYEYRSIMLAFLARHGFTRIGEELNRTDAVRIERFIESGDKSYLERLASYGYRGVCATIATIRVQECRRALIATSIRFAEFRAEQTCFAQMMRTIASSLDSETRVDVEAEPSKATCTAASRADAILFIRDVTPIRT